MLTKASSVCRGLRKGLAPSRMKIVSSVGQRSRISRRYLSDHYATLGVSPTATATEIKKAFFEKAKKVHPDVNKGDPNAQQKFVELGAAYEVLKNQDKRAQYDAERKYGGQNPFGSSSYGQQYNSGPYSRSSGSYSSSQQQQQHYQHHNPFRNNRSAGENPYYAYSSQQRSAEDFMKWYRSQFGDAFREFDEFNRGNTTIIEERMPDGSVRIRIVRTSGGATTRQRPTPEQSSANEFAQQQNAEQLKEMVRRMFGGGLAGKLLSGMWGHMLDEEMQSESSGNGIPFGSAYINSRIARITELWGELSFSMVSANQHVGTINLRSLSDSKGDVLTCMSGTEPVAKARHYYRDGKERILIENGSSKRIAAIDVLSGLPSSISNVIAKSSPTVSVFAPLKNFFSLHYTVLDDQDTAIGYMSISPFRRTIQYLNSTGSIVATATRKDISERDRDHPTRDDWKISIKDERYFDSSVYVFSTAFSTVLERRSKTPLPGAYIALTALANKFRL